MADIFHCNVRGIKTLDLRKGKVSVIQKILDEKGTVFTNLQETHLAYESEIPKVWTHLKDIYYIVFCRAISTDPGSGIIVFVRKTEKILEKQILFEGRLLHIKTENLVSGEVLNFFSLYGKSNVGRNYASEIIEKMNSKIESQNLENLIICGDFNFVTSINDRNTDRYTQTDLVYKDIWTHFEIKNNIIDTFRNLYPKRRLYTFSQTGGNSKSRIDRIYFSGDLVGRLQSLVFENYQCFDHKLLKLRIKNKIETGPGTWIFNCNLLKELNFTQPISTMVGDYATNSRFSSQKHAWEFFKMDFKCSSIKFSQMEARKKRENIEIVRNKLNALESLPNVQISTEIEQEIARLKKLDFDFNRNKIQGFLLRLKIPNFEEGEGNIAYFSKLEKRRGEENLIGSLENEDGIIQQGTENIKQTVHKFYSELYTSQPEDEFLQDELLSNITERITEEEQIFMDQQLSKAECKSALDSFQTGKTPGSDGINKEMLSFFWGELGDFYFSVVNEIFSTEELTESQKKGIIKVLYKKNGRQFMKNYRPISLLNTDLKIITKALAIRFAKVLKNLINHSKKCVQGRRITDNIHHIQDLIDDILNENVDAAFIMVDQEKAFDRISHKFIFKTLKQYGFGDVFIKWIRIIYKNVTSRVKVNGFLTDTIDIQRGVRQGCPLSALLYVLCLEVLSTNIRKNENIIGYKITQNSFENKELLYADDLGVVVTTEESMKHLFDLLKKYELATNAKINQDKTEAMWLGSWIGRTDRPLNLKWTSEEVKFLGIYIGNDRKKASLLTFCEIKDKIKDKISFWNSKFISLKGKSKVLNTFVLSKLWYALECQDLPNLMVKEIEDVIKTFLWNGNNQRELPVVCYPYTEGGLSLQSIQFKMETLRLKWLESLFTQKNIYKQREIVNHLIGNIGQIYGLKVLLYNKNYVNHIRNSYYKNAYKIWKKYHIIFMPKDITTISNDWIYDNILLKDDDGRVFKPPSHYNQNSSQYNIIPKFFRDLPVQIPLGSLRGTLRTIIPKINASFYSMQFSNALKDEFNIQNGLDTVELSSDFKTLYQFLIYKNKKPNSIWETKWSTDFINMNPQLDWHSIWNTIHNPITNYKVQSSIWEMVHRNFTCGYILKIMNIGDGMCKLCNYLEEKRTHIFMSCKVTNAVYQHFSELLLLLYNENITNLEKAFGIYNIESDKIILRNYITYTIRHIVYRSRNLDTSHSGNVVTFLINKIKYFMRKDLYERYHIYKNKNKTCTFVKLYLIENILGSIDNNELTINI